MSCSLLLSLSAHHTSRFSTSCVLRRKMYIYFFYLPGKSSLLEGNLYLQWSLRAKPASGAPLLRKFGNVSPGNVSMRKILVVTSASVRPSVRPYRLWGRGREVPRQPDREGRMPSFLGGKSRGAFGQPAFFLAGNRMTIVAFEKEVSLKSLSLFSKTIVRRYCSFKLEKKPLRGNVH